jgi:TatA/E family protein of Tat protein translocase
MIILFLNLGGGEVLLVLLVVLLFFGSKSIPELARGLGKGLREIREATDNIKREIENGANEVSSNINIKPIETKIEVENFIKEEQENQQSVISDEKKNIPLDQQTE